MCSVHSYWFPTSSLFLIHGWYMVCKNATCTSTVHLCLQRTNDNDKINRWNDDMMIWWHDDIIWLRFADSWPYVKFCKNDKCIIRLGWTVFATKVFPEVDFVRLAASCHQLRIFSNWPNILHFKIYILCQYCIKM